MSPWLFNLYLDGVMREMKGRIMNREKRLEGTGWKWIVNSLVYTDDTLPMTESQESLARFVREFAGMYGRRKLKANVSKSKVMVVSKNGGYKIAICLQGEKMEQIECFRYLRTDIHESVRMGEESDGRNRGGDRQGTVYFP